MFVGLFDAEYALIMAASVVSILPVGIVFLAMQKNTLLKVLLHLE